MFIFNLLCPYVVHDHKQKTLKLYKHLAHCSYANSHNWPITWCKPKSFTMYNVARRKEIPIVFLGLFVCSQSCDNL
jgi:hypothetical protein